MSADVSNIYTALENARCPRCGEILTKVAPATRVAVRLVPSAMQARPGSTVHRCDGRRSTPAGRVRCEAYIEAHVLEGAAA